MNYAEILELKLKILNNKTESSLETKICQAVEQIENLSTNEKMEIAGKLKDEIIGYGAIQKYLDDEDISEIMINGLHRFFIEKKGKLEELPPIFENDQHLMQLIYRIASEVGREINQSKPILDARLKDGSRVNVILNPIAINGPIVTIRKFGRSVICAEGFISSGSFTSEIHSFLLNLVKARYNIFISGGTGTGKTTLLNYISQSIPEDERIITVEDAAEIDISNHRHVISMETRSSSLSDYSVNISKLIKNALRMRPDRIIVGEVRGEEVVDMLQAMNTGHEGSISTGHSNSPMDMLIRLEVISASYSEIDHHLIRKQIISAIDIIIHLERINGIRRIQSIVEIIKYESDYQINTIYDYEKDEQTPTDVFEKRLRNRRKYDKYLKRQA